MHMKDIRRKIFTIVAKVAFVFAVAYWALALTTIRLSLLQVSGHEEAPGFLFLIFVVAAPDVLCALWLFRSLAREHSRQNARHAALAFAFSALIVAGVGNVLGTLAGAYAEAVLGSPFAFPTAMAFNVAWTTLVTSSTVLVWVGARFIEEPVGGLIKHEPS
jgi:hypothetical protein